MNTVTDTSMVRDAVLGTLVADASGMGVHWIYSQGKLSQIAKAHDGVVEFLEPDEANYSGVPAFFAHPRKRAGDSSNYGEYIYVLLESIDEHGFDAGRYIRGFGDYFGIGGEYVGYADSPMRETIYNIARIGKTIERTVIDADSTLSETRRKAAAHYIARYFFESDIDGLKETIRTPLRLQEWSKEELEEAMRLVDVVSESVGGVGPDDDQMPALSRSAVLACFYSGEELDGVVDRAVRITNDNDDAVAYSVFLARILRDLYEAGRPEGERTAQKLRELIERHKGLLGEKARGLIDDALAIGGLDYRGATKTFGAACHVHMAVPLVVHILLNTATFVDANRANLMASGDNCGRAIMLGALAGALYGIGGDAGIPQGWIDRCTIVPRARATAGGKLLLG
ncbi:MAG: ADP-ribosylglycohydrolase family protein [Spirochaetaceae bacterium]|nr:MAG: ADP-ribosylglycohydrolase family protein [Spirochaetaceae bacterium]